MPGPSNIFEPEYAELTTTPAWIMTVPAGYDYSVSVRVINTEDHPILVSLGIGVTSNPASSGQWMRTFDFELEPGKPYDLEENLQLPVGWGIGGRASEDTGVQVTCTGSCKEIV